MIKRLLIGLGLALVVLVIGALVGLLMLRHTVGTYARYWKQRAKSDGQFTYVVLGDSIAQGIGASKPQNGYVGRLASQLELQTGKRVRVVNLSVTGAKINDLLQKQLPELKGYKPDLVTVEIGANDMGSYDRAVFRQQYEQFIKALPAGKSVVSNMPYFGTRKSVNPSARDANLTIAQLASSYNIPLVDIYQPYKTHQSPFIYAADFFHPNDRGYGLWYDAFQPATEQIIHL